MGEWFKMAGAREFYDFDAKDGIIVNKKLGKRSFVLGVREWNNLVEQLHNKFGSGAQVILFDAGKSYGQSELEEGKEFDLERKLSIGLLSHEATVAGWGKTTWTQESPESFTVKLQRCVFCSGSNDPAHRQVGCFFLRGVISGFAEKLFDRGSTVEENHCGKDYCEFKVILNPVLEGERH